jgi:hypothetical protein
MKFYLLSLCITALMSVPTNLRWAYKTFYTEKKHTKHPKPLSGRFTSKFTGVYPHNTLMPSCNDDFITLGFPTTSYNKTYERIYVDSSTTITHIAHVSGHIKCKRGDTQCNNALYALSNSPDFTKCMHMALSHPEIKRTQRCTSLFAALGRFGLADQVLHQPLCKADWKFDVTLDED